MNLESIAKKIINVNLSVKRKDLVVIRSGPESIKFAQMLAYECSIIGAQPTIFYNSSELSLKTYTYIDVNYIKDKPKLNDILSKDMDVEIIIDESNPVLASRLPQDKIQVMRKTMKPIRDFEEKRLIKKDLKILLMGYPTENIAKSLGITFEKLKRVFWNSFDIDYEALYKYNETLAKKFKNANHIRIIGDKTNLEFSVKGRECMNGCAILEHEKMGFINMPDGELFFAPIENSANGEIYFDLPSLWHYGKQVEGVWFKFKDGKVVEYKIDKGQDAFEDVIKNATGDKLNIGELGIGTNPNAESTGGLTIVDEKIKGTIHIAIGDNTLFGGKNESTIHWDFFKTMSKGSLLEVDGKPVIVDGKFIE
ncbi:MAG: aminopeptidase [DPANN group archaeon]|nr:aminopeptidase [DPANN group archaeon]